MSLSIEKAAELGFHLVHKIEGLARFERVHAAGTQKIEGESVDAALEAIESQLAAHPGATGTDISRSDGAAEPRDVLEQQSAQVGPSDLPTPAADIAAGLLAGAVDHPIPAIEEPAEAAEDAEPEAPAEPVES